MSYDNDLLWIQSVRSAVKGINNIFTHCTIDPGVINVVIHAMRSVSEQTSAPVHLQTAARSLVNKGCWRAEEDAVYRILLELTEEPVPSVIPEIVALDPS